jgi:ribosomal protein S20
MPLTVTSALRGSSFAQIYPWSPRSSQCLKNAGRWAGRRTDKLSNAVANWRSGISDTAPPLVRRCGTDRKGCRDKRLAACNQACQPVSYALFHNAFSLASLVLRSCHGEYRQARKRAHQSVVRNAHNAAQLRSANRPQKVRKAITAGDKAAAGPVARVAEHHRYDRGQEIFHKNTASARAGWRRRSRRWPDHPSNSPTRQRGSNYVGLRAPVRPQRSTLAPSRRASCTIFPDCACDQRPSS